MTLHCNFWHLKAGLSHNRHRCQMSKSRRPGDEFHMLQPSDPWMATTVMSQQTFSNFREIQGIARVCPRLHPADHNTDLCVRNLVNRVIHCDLYWCQEHIAREQICAVPLLTTQPIPKDNIGSDRDKLHPSDQPREPTSSHFRIILGDG